VRIQDGGRNIFGKKKLLKYSQSTAKKGQKHEDQNGGVVQDGGQSWFFTGSQALLKIRWKFQIDEDGAVIRIKLPETRFGKGLASRVA